MNKRMVLVVSIEEVDAWLSVNDLIVGLIGAGVPQEILIHEYLRDGMNHFQLIARQETPFPVRTSFKVSIQLQLRHCVGFGAENGRQTILQKTKTIEKGSRLSIKPLLSFEHHIHVAFPRWHCFSSLSCSRIGRDEELAETYLKALCHQFLVKDVEGICRAFSHRNQELAVAYGLDVTESNSRFRERVQNLVGCVSTDEQPVLVDRVVMIRLGQSSVFYPVNQSGHPAFGLALGESSAVHRIPMHLAVHEQQVFIVR